MHDMTEPPLIALFRNIIEDTEVSPIPAPLAEALVVWGIRTGLGPILYELALAAPNLVSCSSFKQLLIAELAAKAAEKRRQTAIIEIIDSCSSCLNSVTLLKGISVAHEYYPKSHWRPMQDIDILVAGEDLHRAETALTKLGYQRPSGLSPEFYHTHHHSMPFYHPSTRVVVELHTALFPASSCLSQASAFQLPNVTAQLCSIDFRGRTAHRLNAELQLVYISCHAVAERRIFSSLVPFLDVAFLLRHAGHELDWAMLSSWLVEATVSTDLSVILSYLEKHCLAELPPAAQETFSVAETRMGKLARNVISRGIDRYAANGQSKDDFLGCNNRMIIWDSLLTSRSPLLNFLRIPMHLAFPPSNPHRFRVGFQLKRLRSAMRRARKQSPS